jgi:hypothetical protein
MADAGIGACMYLRTRVCLDTVYYYYYFLPSVVPVTDLIFGGFRNVLLGVCCSAWPGARAMAADVSYPDVVRYVRPHLRMMTTRIIPVSPQQRHGKHHQRQKRMMTVLE